MINGEESQVTSTQESFPFQDDDKDETKNTGGLKIIYLKTNRLLSKLDYPKDHAEWNLFWYFCNKPN